MGDLSPSGDRGSDREGDWRGQGEGRRGNVRTTSVTADPVPSGNGSSAVRWRGASGGERAGGAGEKETGKQEAQGQGKGQGQGQGQGQGRRAGGEPRAQMRFKPWNRQGPRGAPRATSSNTNTTWGNSSSRKQSGNSSPPGAGAGVQELARKIVIELLSRGRESVGEVVFLRPGRGRWRPRARPSCSTPPSGTMYVNIPLCPWEWEWELVAALDVRKTKS